MYTVHHFWNLIFQADFGQSEMYILVIISNLHNLMNSKDLENYVVSTIWVETTCHCCLNCCGFNTMKMSFQPGWLKQQILNDIFNHIVMWFQPLQPGGWNHILLWFQMSFQPGLCTSVTWMLWVWEIPLSAPCAWILWCIHCDLIQWEKFTKYVVGWIWVSYWIHLNWLRLNCDSA